MGGRLTRLCYSFASTAVAGRLTRLSYNFAPTAVAGRLTSLSYGFGGMFVFVRATDVGRRNGSMAMLNRLFISQKSSTAAWVFVEQVTEMNTWYLVEPNRGLCSSCQVTTRFLGV